MWFVAYAMDPQNSILSNFIHLLYLVHSKPLKSPLCSSITRVDEEADSKSGLRSSQKCITITPNGPYCAIYVVLGITSTHSGDGVNNVCVIDPLYGNTCREAHIYVIVIALHLNNIPKCWKSRKIDISTWIRWLIMYILAGGLRFVL